LLDEVGLSLADAGGNLTFYGSDPIAPTSIRYGAAAATALAAKAVAIAAIWKMRTGEGQSIHVDVRKALRRFTVFFDGQWEKLNGRAGGYPWMVGNPFQVHPLLFRAKDGRWVMPLNMYPRLRSQALTLLKCADNLEAVKDGIAKRDGLQLEDAGAQAGVVMPMLRTTEEFMKEPQYTDVLADAPLIGVEKTQPSEPIPFSKAPHTPLDGIRALGMGHVIAGAGIGRAFALHGADVLNIWQPLDVEHDRLYNTSNVGMRSSILSLKDKDDRSTFDGLMAKADLFFANRRPQYLERYGLSAQELCAKHPGLIHIQVFLHGERGPWANRVGFDESAGAVTGINFIEGSEDEPRLSTVKVVNDYISGWLANVGALAALKRRATEGGSYRITVSLTRTCLWMLSLGLFDRLFAQQTAGSTDEHTYVPPELFQARTPLGLYQGVTEQVEMTKTPGEYSTILIPRGSSEARWLP
jgi:crotonobetainyl-CoA:carnitine CoA-transferase CaiB-like acyl-CoA transferase